MRAIPIRSIRRVPFQIPRPRATPKPARGISGGRLTPQPLSRPARRAALSPRRAGHIEHDLATDEEHKRLPQYNELYMKSGLPGFAAIGMAVEGPQWAIPFMRGLNQGHFTPAEAERIAQAAPHLARLVLFSDKFALARAQAGLDALEGVAYAAFALDWRASPA